MVHSERGVWFIGFLGLRSAELYRNVNHATIPPADNIHCFMVIVIVLYVLDGILFDLEFDLEFRNINRNCISAPTPAHSVSCDVTPTKVTWSQVMQITHQKVIAFL